MYKFYIYKRKLLLLSYIYLRNNRKTREYGVHPINRTRRQFGEYFTLVKTLEKYPMKYFNYFRMSKATFDKIYQQIKSLLLPKYIFPRNNIISAKEKLVITLRFLATGATYVDLSMRFRMGLTTVQLVIKQTLDAIITKLLDIAIPSKRTPTEWERIANQLHSRWNFPNCLGALDGKHIHTFAPNNSGSFYFNYKKSFSINLMALVDAEYKFIMVDIGAYGSNSDSTVFGSCDFGKAFMYNPKEINIPDGTPLPGTISPLPYVIIADEGFGLKPRIMRPYPGRKLDMRKRIFNYRLSRARRVVENAFGILSTTWRVLLDRMEVQVESINKITLACCILHNILRMSEFNVTINDNTSDNDTENVQQTTHIDASTAYDIRESFADWCIDEGDLNFQYNMI